VEIGHDARSLWSHARGLHHRRTLGLHPQAGLTPQKTGGYSRFVTEMIELVINFGYVRVLSKKRGGAQPGHIAPVSSGELKTHGMAYKVYSLLFPFAWAVSLLDNLFPAKTDNAVIVTALKQDGA
jgi:hypothetical protein